VPLSPESDASVFAASLRCALLVSSDASVAAACDFFVVDLDAGFRAVPLLVLDFFAVLLVDFLAAPPLDFFAVPLLVDFFGAESDVLVSALLLSAEVPAGGRLDDAAEVSLPFDADRFAVEAALAAVLAAVLTAAFGSFLAPDTTALNSAPALNFGTAIRLSPVFSPADASLAGRRAFSNAPNPLIATFSPRATSRVIVSSTDSSACLAAFLLPPNWLDSASMSWLLFTSFPFTGPRRPSPVLGVANAMTIEPHNRSSA
jgi:hypothetical protein